MLLDWVALPNATSFPPPPHSLSSNNLPILCLSSHHPPSPPPLSFQVDSQTWFRNNSTPTSPPNFVCL
jgi:hypothetical protein